PDTYELVHRIADPRRLLDGGRVHRTPPPHHHVVGLVAAHIQPDGGLILHLIGRHGILYELEAELLGSILEKRNRLAAVARIEEDEADLLATQLVQSAFLLADVLDDARRA